MCILCLRRRVAELHDSSGILLHRTFVTFSSSTNVSVTYLYQHGLTGVYFLCFGLRPNATLFICLFCSNCPALTTGSSVVGSGAPLTHPYQRAMCVGFQGFLPLLLRDVLSSPCVFLSPALGLPISPRGFSLRIILKPSSGHWLY